jgi:hypothetical protein
MFFGKAVTAIRPIAVTEARQNGVSRFAEAADLHLAAFTALDYARKKPRANRG